MSKGDGSRQPILPLLISREIGKRPSSSRPLPAASCPLPNKLATSVHPPGYLRRFTANGQRLIAFSYDLRRLAIYRFIGPVLAPCCSSSRRHRNWDNFFELEHSLHIVSRHQRGVLCKDFCLETECGQYIIVAETRLGHEDDEDEWPSLSFPNPSSLDMPDETKGLDFHFYVIRLSDGEITEHLRFADDYIRLYNHDGVYLYGQSLGILSVTNQTLHLFQFYPDTGLLVKTNDVGWFCDPTDEVTLLMARESERMFQDHDVEDLEMDLDTLMEEVDTSTLLSGLKQRILSRLYRDCADLPYNVSRNESFRLFYAKFQHVARMILWRFQFLDADHLLLLYSADREPDAAQDGNGQPQEPAVKPSLLVYYNISTTTVLQIMSSTSEKLADLYRHYYPQFQYGEDLPSSRSKILEALDSGLLDFSTRKKLIALMTKDVPNECQKRNQDSVYLNSQNFRYNPAIGWGVHTHAQRIRVEDKDTGQLLFELVSPSRNREGDPGDNTTEFLFHPTMPFILASNSFGKLNIHFCQSQGASLS